MITDIKMGNSNFLEVNYFVGLSTICFGNCYVNRAGCVVRSVVLEAKSHSLMQLCA